jgi:septal ring factor EnvC (AmiA/AmiB activator)
MNTLSTPARHPLRSLTRFHWIATALACTTLGLSMPSCPGTQAMQQQLELLDKQQASLKQQIQTLEQQNKKFETEMGQVTQLLSQVSSTVLAQKSAIEQMEKSLQELAAKAAAPKPAAPKDAAKPKPKKK